jgi:hypothetical protein
MSCIEDSELSESLLDSVDLYIAKVPCGQGGCFPAWISFPLPRCVYLYTDVQSMVPTYGSNLTIISEEFLSHATLKIQADLCNACGKQSTCPTHERRTAENLGV